MAPEISVLFRDGKKFLSPYLFVVSYHSFKSEEREHQWLQTYANQVAAGSYDNFPPVKRSINNRNSCLNARQEDQTQRKVIVGKERKERGDGFSGTTGPRKKLDGWTDRRRE